MALSISLSHISSRSVLIISARMFLGRVREQTVQKEEGERVCGGTRIIPPILCRIHLRIVAHYRLQILKKLRKMLHLARQD